MITLVTGITGLIGSEYLKIIMASSSAKKDRYILLIRERHEEYYKDLIENHQWDHIEYRIGDLLSPDIFTAHSKQDGLEEDLGKIDRIVHLAALYDLKAPYSKLFKVNVVGTQNLLFLAARMKSLKEVFFASTIAVAGNWQGIFSEADFDLGQEFPDAYSQSKFESEKLVRDFAYKRPQVRVTIARFGIVVGHSQTGHMSRMDGPYFLLKHLTLLKKQRDIVNQLPFIYFPYQETSEIPIVPVDFAASVINGLKNQKKQKKEKDQPTLRVLHIIAKHPPTHKRLMDDFLRIMGIELEVRALPVSNPLFNSFLLPLTKKILKKFSIPESLADYMTSKGRVTSHLLEGELKKSIEIPQYSEFSDTILEYSLKHFKH